MLINIYVKLFHMHRLDMLVGVNHIRHWVSGESGILQEGQDPLTGQRAANFKLLANQ